MAFINKKIAINQLTSGDKATTLLRDQSITQPRAIDTPAPPDQLINKYVNSPVNIYSIIYTRI